jgi:hypothetical protein
MLKTEQIECVSYGVACGVLYRVDSEKSLTSEDGRQE